MRTAKKNSQFYEIFTAYDYDGITKLSGLTVADGEIGLTFYKNGVEVVGQSATVIEDGSTGNYSLNTSFSTTGYWVIFIFIIDTDTSDIICEFRSDIEVSAYTIDDVYSEIGDSESTGVGNETCILTLEDSNNDDTVIPTVAVNIFNEEKTAFITYGYTNVDGQITFYLDEGTYTVVSHKPGYSIDETTIVVTDEGGIVDQSFTIEGASVNVIAPTKPGVCRLFADFTDQSGSPLSGFKVSVVTLYNSSSSLSISVAEGRKVYTANSSGHIQFDIIQGIAIEVSLVSTEVTAVLTVPSSPVANLLTLIEDADTPAGGLAIITI